MLFYVPLRVFMKALLFLSSVLVLSVHDRRDPAFLRRGQPVLLQIA